MLLFLLIFYVKNRKDSGKESANWITDYQKSNKALPPIPDAFLQVVINPEKGNLVSKEMKLRPMSGQFWNKLSPSQQRKLQQLVEWLGENWDDYYAIMQRSLPKPLKLRAKNKPFNQG